RAQGVATADLADAGLEARAVGVAELVQDEVLCTSGRERIDEDEQAARPRHQRTCRKVAGSDRSVGGPSAGSTRTPRDSISSTLALRWSFTRSGSPAPPNRVPGAAPRSGAPAPSWYPSSRYH